MEDTDLPGNPTIDPLRLEKLSGFLSDRMAGTINSH
jgi:hypothetical protein